MIGKHRTFLAAVFLTLDNVSLRSHALFHSKEMTALPSTAQPSAVHPALLHNNPHGPSISLASGSCEESTVEGLSPGDSLTTRDESGISPQDYRGALVKTFLTVSCACLFGVGLTIVKGRSTGHEFFCSYLVEQSLSIDNIFVFIMLFDYFQVPLESQSRVLAWGITGAIVLRGVMIMAGVAVLQRFKSVLLGFAAILLLSSYKLLSESRHDSQTEDLKNNSVMKVASLLFPNTSNEFHGEDFFVVQDGRRFVTPLFLCLVCVELSDFVFAVDSIPAVLGVTHDPIVVYSSNIFAIMALRSLYTVVAKAVSEWHYLKPSVALVLGFVGMKMILEYFHMPIATDLSLGVICTLLGGGVALSIMEKRRVSKKYNLAEQVSTVLAENESQVHSDTSC